MTYDPAADPVHGTGWNSAAHWGGWDWRGPRRGEHFRTCSFCGSIHPEDLAAVPAGSGCGYPLCPEPRNELARIHFPAPGEDGREREYAEGLPHRYVDTGWRASWADLKYGWPHKFYVEGLRPRDPEMLHCIGSSSHDPDDGPFGRGGLQWYKVSECPPELIEAAKADGMRHSAERPDGWLGFGPRETLHAKFYTRHLADPRLSDEVKEKITQACGLRFRFLPDGRIGWCPATDPPHEHDDVPA